MQITETIKLVIVAGLASLVLLFGQKVYDWKQGSDQNEQRGRTMTATTGIIADGDKADTAREETDTGLATGRDTFKANIEEAKRHEPETAVRATRAVPNSVRKSFRERRLARERLGCTGEQCGPGLEDADAPQR